MMEVDEPKIEIIRDEQAEPVPQKMDDEARSEEEGKETVRLIKHEVTGKKTNQQKEGLVINIKREHVTYLLIAIIFSAIGFGASYLFNDNIFSGITGMLSNAGNEVDIIKMDSSSKESVMGSATAKVEMIYFSDFECAFCVKFFKETLPEIEEKYINTGKVRLVFKNFPLSFHANAQKAAEAGECAKEQGKFWEMHDTMFSEGVSGGVETLKEYAQEIGLSLQEFNECLDSGAMEGRVNSDIDEGKTLSVSGTPSFMINGAHLVGAQPFSTFEKIIEEELAK